MRLECGGSLFPGHEPDFLKHSKNGNNEIVKQKIHKCLNLQFYNFFNCIFYNYFLFLWESRIECIEDMMYKMAIFLGCSCE